MPFKIKIIETTRNEEMTKGRWTVVSKVGTEEKYGYAPDRVEPSTREREVLSQEIETLDLAAVIKAVNKL